MGYEYKEKNMSTYLLEQFNSRADEVVGVETISQGNLTEDVIRERRRQIERSFESLEGGTILTTRTYQELLEVLQKLSQNV